MGAVYRDHPHRRSVSYTLNLNKIVKIVTTPIGKLYFKLVTLTCSNTTVLCVHYWNLFNNPHQMTIFYVFE